MAQCVLYVTDPLVQDWVRFSLVFFMVSQSLHFSLSQSALCHGSALWSMSTSFTPALPSQVYGTVSASTLSSFHKLVRVTVDFYNKDKKKVPYHRFFEIYFEQVDLNSIYLQILAFEQFTSISWHRRNSAVGVL